MFKIYATQPTVIKRNAKPSNVLSNTEKFNLSPSDKPLVAKWINLEGSHYRFELAEPFRGVYLWYAFADHVRYVDTSVANLNGGTFLTLTKGTEKDEYSLYKLRLTYIKNGQEQDHIFVCSGLPAKQWFHTGKDSRSGSNEPLPEGRWYIHDMQWAGGKDNYRDIWSTPGIGPVKILLDYKGPDRTDRSEIMIHIDWNRPPRDYSPGTRGCIGVYNIPDFKRLTTWLRDTNPRDLYVDWGLGTCPKPMAAQQAPNNTTQPTAATPIFPHTAEDVDIMARTIWGEARGENQEGKVAVGWVIRNRASRSPAYNWPFTLRAVCRQPFQFSCWNSDDSNAAGVRSVTTRDPSFRECLDVAKKVTSGELADNSHGADHYYNPQIPEPGWARGRTPVARIGNHVFFRLVGR